MIEPFDIVVTLEGTQQQLRVEPQDKQSEPHEYKVYKGEALLGTIWPDCVDEGVCWYSSDDIPEDTLMKIGDAIERYDL